MIDKIIKWITKYQPNLSQKDGKELYMKLIQEEKEETLEALNKKDLREFLDGLGDQVWVKIGLFYITGFLQNTHLAIISFERDLTENCTFEGDIYDILSDLMHKITESNFTKELRLESTGDKKYKVIKGENFVMPDIDYVINKYNIKFK